MSRLTREYRKIQQSGGFVSDNILVRPLPDKLHEWHFLLFDLGRPFTGGIYHGMLKFPKDYPFAPPAIFMLTPNGRFETNRRLCFSMSDYHPETWNPLWTVETLLIGFASFMFGAWHGLEDTDTESKMIGYVKSSDEEKLQLARMSYMRVTGESVVLSLFPDLTRQGHYNELISHFSFKDEILENVASNPPQTEDVSSNWVCVVSLVLLTGLAFWQW